MASTTTASASPTGTARKAPLKEEPSDGVMPWCLVPCDLWPSDSQRRHKRYPVRLRTASRGLRRVPQTALGANASARLRAPALLILGPEPRPRVSSRCSAGCSGTSDGGSLREVGEDQSSCGVAARCRRTISALRHEFHA